MYKFQIELNRKGRYSKSYPNYKPLRCGHYELSIQGSKYHYSVPRKTIKPEQYTRMEIAIFNGKGWFDVTRSKVINNFPRIEELKEFYEGETWEIYPYPVFPYVPVDLIEDLYLYLKNHNNG